MQVVLLDRTGAVLYTATIPVPQPPPVLLWGARVFVLQDTARYGADGEPARAYKEGEAYRLD